MVKPRNLSLHFLVLHTILGIRQRLSALGHRLSAKERVELESRDPRAESRSPVKGSALAGLLRRYAVGLLLPLFASLPCGAETVLLDFSSSSCMPCRQMRPVVRQIKAAGYQVHEISIDRQPQVATKYRVDRVPTFIVVTDGVEAARLTGTTSFSQLKQMLDRGGATQPLASQSSSQAPIVPLGETPAAGPPSQDLSTPQPGRILAIQNPNPALHRQTPPAANPFGQASHGQAATGAGSVNDVKRLIEATVKISIKDPDGTSVGTGTLVDARSGEALILTCGHLFRSSGGKGPITVTLYQMGAAGAEVRTSLSGNLIEYDLDRDLALVSVRPDVPVNPVKIGTQDTGFSDGDGVTSVGCNTGHNPTAVSSRIVSINRYQGHPNLEVAGAPIEGRSGGGLFNAQGQLIGVCYAADPQSDEGLYASLPSVHQKLDEMKLAMIYQDRPAEPRTPAPPEPQTLLAAHEESTPGDTRVLGQFPEEQGSAEQAAALLGAAPSHEPPARAAEPAPRTPISLSSAEQAALEEIASRAASAEVICIIRPHSPDGKSEVLKLQNVSPDFVRALNASAQSAANPAMAAGPASGASSYR